MSVLIKGMEMPKPKLAGIVAIYNAYVVVKHNGDVKIVIDNEDKTDSTEYYLVPVPPHGRLIDADALLQDAQMMLLTCETYGNQFAKPYEVLRAIALAKTIIPADKEET